MSENNEHVILDSMADMMKKHGYRKKKNSWYRETEETVLVANLQKSSWGSQFYINLGISIKEIDPAKEPPEYKCHIRSRLEDGSVLAHALNAESTSMSPVLRKQTIQNSMQDAGVPFLSLGETLCSLVNAYRDGRLPDSKLSLVAKRAIERSLTP